MASVTVALTGYGFTINLARWSDHISVGYTFAANNQTQTIEQLDLYKAGSSSGTVHIFIIGSNNTFTPAFEATGRIIFTASDGEILEIMIANADMTEEYRWIPTNSAEVIAFANHVHGLTNRDVTLTLTDDPPVVLVNVAGTKPTATGNVATKQFLDVDIAGDQPNAIGTVTERVTQFLDVDIAGNKPSATGSISSAIPFLLSDFNQDNLTVPVLGLVTAGAAESNGTNYRHSTNGGPLGSLSSDSDFTVVVGQSITRISTDAPDGDTVRIWDNPSTATWSGYFTDNPNLTIRIQTADAGPFELTKGAQGGNFSSWRTTNAAAITAITGISEGDKYILAIAETTVVTPTSISVDGTKPSAVGNITAKQSLDIAISGNKPAAIGGTAVKYLIDIVGSKPAATGSVSAKQSTHISISGNKPIARGDVTTTRFTEISGSKPATTGIVSSSALSFPRVFPEGSHPAPSGFVSSAQRIYVNVTGNKPALTGTVNVRQSIDIAGVKPSSTSSLNAVVTVAMQSSTASVIGNKPTSAGGLSIKQSLNIVVVGAKPNSIGILSVKQFVTANVTGDHSNSTGAISFFIIGYVPVDTIGDHPNSTGTIIATFLMNKGWAPQAIASVTTTLHQGFARRSDP